MPINEVRTAAIKITKLIRLKKVLLIKSPIDSERKAAIKFVKSEAVLFESDLKRPTNLVIK